MSTQNASRQAQFPPDLVRQLRGAVEEAFKSFGNEAAVLIMYYARSRHNVDMNALPTGIEELDGVLTEVLGPARHMVISQCAEILRQRLGIEVPQRTERLSDIFRQVARAYQARKGLETSAPLVGELEEESAMSRSTKNSSVS